MGDENFILAKQEGVRISLAEIDKLACQAKQEDIFAKRTPPHFSFWLVCSIPLHSRSAMFALALSASYVCSTPQVRIGFAFQTNPSESLLSGGECRNIAPKEQNPAASAKKTVFKRSFFILWWRAERITSCKASSTYLLSLKEAQDFQDTFSGSSSLRDKRRQCCPSRHPWNRCHRCDLPRR